MRKIMAADLFCGAGGASTALRRACNRLGLGVELVAVNHWPIAIETHSANHPGARHLCASIEQVDPREAVPGGRLSLLLAAPECTQHSRARGGRPIHDQKRTSAYQILKWLSELYVDNVLIENVPEFQEWAPLGANGKPLKSKKGQLFRGFLESLVSHGYRVEHRVLNAADYGDYTTRQRLFIQAKRKGPIRWPAPTHSPTGQRTLFGTTETWRPARDIIDWSIPGKSIFGRKKPLQPKTIARIIAGLERFGGAELQPFLVVLRNNAAAQSLDVPIPTVTAGGVHAAVVQPILMHVTHGGRARSVDAPLPTVTGAHRGELGVVTPFVIGQQSCAAPREVGRPLPTIATAGAIRLVEACLVPFYGERAGQEPRAHAVRDPIPTIPASPKFGLAQPFLTSYYSTGGVTPVTDPLPTVTTRDRFALVRPVIGDKMLDIHFRMLRPHELARAMGFGDEYHFAGNGTDQVKQIGNAWPVGLGQALIETMLGGAP